MSLCGLACANHGSNGTIGTQCHREGAKPHCGFEMKRMSESDQAIAALHEQIPGTQSIGRAVQVLRAIASNGRRGCRFEDIVGKTMLSKTTCARVLNRLVCEQLLRKQDVSGKYFLGPLLDELGILARPEYRLAQHLDSVLERLAHETQDTVYLSERSGLDAVCTACKMGSFPIKVLPLDTGLRRPLGVATGGVAILAGLDALEADHIVRAIGERYERHENLSQALVEQRLKVAREAGFVSGPSFGAPGATSISMPLAFTHPIAAISVTALSSRMTADRQVQIVKLLQKEIASLSV